MIIPECCEEEGLRCQGASVNRVCYHEIRAVPILALSSAPSAMESVVRMHWHETTGERTLLLRARRSTS